MLVLTSRADDIVTVTLNRPDKRNALSPGLIDELNTALVALEADEALRVVIIAGAGRCFCAGMDLSGVLDDPVAMGSMLQGLSAAMHRIRQLPVPTISAVHGAAVGGGCGLMAVTDFAVVAPGAKIGYPEVSLGVCPAVVAPWLVQKVGSGRARALLLAGGTMSGTEAQTAGLVTHLADDPVAEASILAAKLATGGARALSVTKRWLNELDGSNAVEVYERGAALSAEVIAGDEAQERLRRFMERTS